LLADFIPLMVLITKKGDNEAVISPQVGQLLKQTHSGNNRIDSIAITEFQNSFILMLLSARTRDTETKRSLDIGLVS